MSANPTDLSGTLRTLTGAERMQRAKRYVFELGYDRARGDKLRGGMVAVYFDNDDQVIDALETLIELWSVHRRACEHESDRPHLSLIYPTRSLEP